MSRLYQYEPSAVALRSWPPLRKVLPAKTKRELSSSYITLKWRNFIMFCIVLCVCRLFHAGLMPFSRRRPYLTLNMLIKRCNIVLMLKIAGMTVEPQRFGRF